MATNFPERELIMLSIPLVKSLICCLMLGGMCVLASSGVAATPLTGTVKTINGTDKNLADYQGKVVLIVNVASQCGYTSQYAGLQKLYEAYKDRGFVVLGFPANDFGAQEPGTDSEIASFCSTSYGVTFDMFAKSSVKGANKMLLYETLTSSAKPAGEVGWNFEKFLVDREGQVIGRFKSGVSPQDPKLIAAIESAL